MIFFLMNYLKPRCCGSCGMVMLIYLSNVAARPGFQKPGGAPPLRSHLDPIPLTEKGLLPADYVMEDPESHFIYVCKKIAVPTDLPSKSADSLADDAMRR